MIEYPSNKEGQISASPQADCKEVNIPPFPAGRLCECADAWHPLFCFYFVEVLIIAKLDHQLNEEIRDKEIRVIGEDGTQLGIMSADQANALAEEQGFDLVKISPNAVPPVCKIMDYSKFCFDQKKREKEAKKNQHVVEVKEIRMSPGIDTNDFNTKVKSAQKFLKDGDRVKVSVRFRGREMAHTDLGEKLLMNFAEACADTASMEKNPKLEGRFMGMFLAPKNSK
ncbi:MAG: translation initiation factor IF-3 [Oscillospiraceae bacterium]|nr:translation initiation factor IF-3 [Oscillospiraceae bacterium]